MTRNANTVTCHSLPALDHETIVPPLAASAHDYPCFDNSSPSVAHANVMFGGRFSMVATAIARPAWSRHLRPTSDHQLP